jgi:hypothetical protein
VFRNVVNDHVRQHAKFHGIPSSVARFFLKVPN